MPNLITETARRIASTKVMEFLHPNTKLWQDGQLVAGTTDDFRGVFTNVAPGVYGPGTLDFRLKGASPEVRGTNANSVTVYGPTTVPTPTPVVTVPEAPLIGSSTPGDGRVTTTASAPASSGGSPVTSYRVYRNGGLVALAANLTSLSYLDTTALNGTPYSYQWTAVNSKGESDRSAASAPVTPTAAVVTPPPNPVYNRTLRLGDGIDDGMSFTPPGAETLSFDLLTGTSGASIDIAITALGATSYVTLAGEYAGKGYQFSDANGVAHYGTFPSADNLGITY